jgi:hypothetical protein
MNHLEKIYAVDLTKSIFVDYCFVQNSKNSNLEYIIYKNPYNIKYLIFACMFISLYKIDHICFLLIIIVML